MTYHTFFEWLFRSTLNASGLIAVIFVAKTVFGTKLSVKWHNALWLLLIFRMIFPWGVDSVVDLGVLIPLAMPSSLPASAPPMLAEGTTVSAAAVAVSAAIENQTQSALWRAVDWRQLVMAVWALGTIFLIGVTVRAHLNLARRVRRDPTVRDGDIQRIFERCRAQMGVGKHVDIASTIFLDAPAVFGLLKPRILLPAGILRKLTHAEIRYIFLHELAHIKRNDVLIRWLSTLLLAAHWFNPLVWVAFRRMKQDREIAADGLALSLLHESETKPYGKTIVRILEQYSSTLRLPSLANLVDNISSLKRRVIMICAFEPGSYRWSPAAIFMFVPLLGVALSFGNAPAWTKAEPEEAEGPAALAATEAPFESEVSYFEPDGDRIFLDDAEEAQLSALVEPEAIGAGAEEKTEDGTSSRARVQRRARPNQQIAKTTVEDPAEAVEASPALALNERDPLRKVDKIGRLSMSGMALEPPVSQTGRYSMSDRAVLPPKSFDSEPRTAEAAARPTAHKQSPAAQPAQRKSQGVGGSSMTIEERIALYNADPENKYNPIVCSREIPTGRNIPHTVCRIQLKTGNHDLQVARVREALQKVNGIRVQLMRLSDQYVAWVLPR